MENVELLSTLEETIIEHIKNNYHLLLNDEAKIKSDFFNQDIRRLTYCFRINTKVDGWKEIVYEFKIAIKSL